MIYDAKMHSQWRKYPEYLPCTFVVVHDIMHMICGSVCNVSLFINLAMLNEWSKLGSHETRWVCIIKQIFALKFGVRFLSQSRYFALILYFTAIAHTYAHTSFSMSYCFRRRIIYTCTRHPLTNTKKKTTRRRQTPYPLEFGS